MRRLLTYMRNEPLKVVMSIIIVFGVVSSVWMAWGDNSKLSTIALTIATAVFAYQGGKGALGCSSRETCD